MPWDGFWATGPHGFGFGAGRHGFGHSFGHRAHDFDGFHHGPGYGPFDHGHWGWDDSSFDTVVGPDTADAKFGEDDVVTCSSSSSEFDDEDVAMIEKDESPCTVRDETPAANDTTSAGAADGAARTTAAGAANAEAADNDTASSKEPDAHGDAGKRRDCHGGYHSHHWAHGNHGNGRFFSHPGCRTRDDRTDGYFGPGCSPFGRHRFSRAGRPAGFSGHLGGHHHGRHGSRRRGPGGPFGPGGFGGPFGHPVPIGVSGPFGPFDPNSPDETIRRGWKRMIADLGDYHLARNLQGYSGDTAAAVASAGDHFCPSVDIFENDKQDGWTLHVALPGAKKCDTDIQWDADRGLLTISGVITRPGDAIFLKGLIKAERDIGFFKREIRLPPWEVKTDSGAASTKQEVDAPAITARMDDGLLTVTVPTVDKEWTAVRQVDIAGCE
ncbi:hypothetical protein SEPCBS119000_001146 [Sporothrix epigloea]|uniref:SHSP domain-containing protein n=1 Tax=Sporothrix epigloea TaxID=1892477 RepID=A0ABP0D946_9PEZI